MTGQLLGVVDRNPFSVGALVPAGAAAGAYGSSSTVNFQQVINSPKALSASEHTREAKAALDRTKWQLP